MTNLMAEAETKSVEMPDWAEIGPDLLDALREAKKALTVFRMNVMVEVIGGNARFEGCPEILANDIANIDAAIARAEEAQ